MDQAGLLSAGTRGYLENLLFKLQRQGTLQLQVLTLQSLGGLSIEEASIKITDVWKLGNKGTDKGVLFLIVPSERKMRIEVGRGLEGDIPDITAKRIIADLVTPYFRESRFDEGVTAGVLAIVRAADPQALQGEAGPPVPPEPERHRKKGLPAWVIFLIFFILIIRLLIGGGGGFGRRGGWGGGGFGGGFGGGGFGGGGGWGGGGGGFSGGGSSGSW